MGEFWILLDIDTRTKYQLGKLGWFDTEHWHILAQNLAEPVLSVLPPLKNGSTKKAERVVSLDSSLGRFQLAIELIDMIFEKIDDVYDATMLGLTHDTLMVIGWKHIRGLLPQTITPWAGGRIICVGDHGNDLPEGVISEDELEELRELIPKEEQGAWGELARILSKSHEPETGNQATRFNLHDIGLHFEGAEIRFGMDDERILGLSSKERQVLSQIIEQPEGYHWEEGWVLMNLSKKLYVKSKAASRIVPEMKATDARCFGQLLFSRICWSSNDTGATRYERPLHRGIWAGDRFKIVTAAVFETRTSSEEWKDVSVEATVWLKNTLWGEEEDVNRMFGWQNVNEENGN